MNERFLELALKYLEGEEQLLEPDEARELARMLRGDAGFRRQLAMLCTHACMVRETYGPEHLARPAARRPARRRVAMLAPLLAVALLVGLLARPWQQGAKQVAVAPRLATLGAVTGDVRIASPAAEARGAQAGMALHGGDGVRLEGPAATAEVEYTDGSRLLLIGDTAVTLCDGPGKAVEMSRGMLLAVVTLQPAGAPMTITTPGAHLRVLGTDFSVRADEQRTDLRVREGRVAVARSADGESVEVPSGKAVLVEPGSALALTDIPEPPATWEMDFEDGLPEGMTHGRPVTDGLPAGSRGGVAAARTDRGAEGVYYNIGTPELWRDGLFAIHPKTHLHVTLKMARPDWLNFFVICRRFEAQGPNSVNYLFDGLTFWRIKAEQWITVSIPLSQFRPLASVPGEPFANQTPYKLLLSAQEPDRGLVIDRMWVTRGGPGRVTYTQVE
jgi:ferric-dicitrate binding protein FerR (iron transport regulator)